MSKFYYFGFGSNMLMKRIHIQNPTAVRIGPGELKNYRLDFHTSSKNWRGAPATIVSTHDASVFGAIWQIDISNMASLDNQEGVKQGIYRPMCVPVLSMKSGEILQCRAYLLNNQPEEDLRCSQRDSIPFNRQPSRTYLKVIVQGAIETGAPKDYVDWLRTIKHNGVMVDALEQKLGLDDVKLFE